MPFWSDERLEHLEAALDALDDAVMVVDEDLCIVAFNRAAEKLTGFTRQEALGSRCFEVCAGRFCRRVCDIEGLFATRRPPEDFESPVLSKDGRVRLVRVRTVPLTGRGNRILAAVRILRDVTAELGSRPGVDQRERDRCKGYGRLVGASRPMLRLYEALEALRDSEWPILVQGPRHGDRLGSPHSPRARHPVGRPLRARAHRRPPPCHSAGAAARGSGPLRGPWPCAGGRAASRS
ncbi:MAG: PAS domain-containing protein [Limnochordaceae bacterium]|nr:PAS domain-containing protein [Limnochordaceae bacterium]